MGTDDNPFDDYNQLAMAMLGDCVMAWSHVEVSTDTAVRSLFFMSGLTDDAAEMIALNLGLREKCSIIASLAYLHRPNDRWLSNVLSVANTISNDLRNQRNRILHDTWTIEGTGQLHRKRRSALRVGRPQSREFELVIPSAEPADTTDIHLFAKQAGDAVIELNDLMAAMLDVRRQELERESDARSPPSEGSQMGRLGRLWNRLSRPPQSSQE